MPFFDVIANIFVKAQGIIAILSFAVTLIALIIQQRRLIRAQKQQTYQRLELASNEVFRFSASHAGVLVHYQASQPDPSIDFQNMIVENSVADNHIFQTLNLFEMAVRFRHAGILEDDVFGSWVIWYHEMLESWYFRHIWPAIRPNYTKDMQRIFDGPVRDFDPRMDDAERREKFFAHVAKELDCPVVKRWLRDAA